MISFWAERNERSSCHSKKNPLAFFTNLFKRKKYKYKGDEISESMSHCSQKIKIPKVPTTLSVSVMDMRISSPYPLSPALSTLTLTPGRTRDIDQDMEALRLSRQDNPFLQVLASRESLVESVLESESDDANLMSQELSELDVDPLSLPEIHEHMIRSPPPTTWPRSPNFKVFQFPQDLVRQDGSSSSYRRSHMRSSLDENSRFPQHNELYDSGFGTYSTIHSTHSPRVTIVHRPHQRSSSECRDHSTNSMPFMNPTPLRSLADVRRCEADDRKRLAADLDEPERHDPPPTIPLLSKLTSS